MNILERFRSKFVLMESGCHEWRSTLHRDGYGKFYMNGETIQGHRAAWILLIGEIPENSWVLHKCDNRKCVNPEHLYLGNAKQNAKDRTDRKRYKVTTPFEVIQTIRQEYATGEYSQQQLADKYGVKQSQVSRYILNRQRVDI